MRTWKFLRCNPNWGTTKYLKSGRSLQNSQSLKHTQAFSKTERPNSAFWACTEVHVKPRWWTLKPSPPATPELRPLTQILMLNEEKKLVTIKPAGEMLQLGLAQSGDRDLVSVYLSMGWLFALISRHDWQASEFKSSQVIRYPWSKHRIFLDYLHPQIIFNFIISNFDFFFSCSHKWPLFRHSRYVSEASWIGPSQAHWYSWSKFDFVSGIGLFFFWHRCSFPRDLFFVDKFFPYALSRLTCLMHLLIKSFKSRIHIKEK